MKMYYTFLLNCNFFLLLLYTLLFNVITIIYFTTDSTFQLIAHSSDVEFRRLLGSIPTVPMVTNHMEGGSHDVIDSVERFSEIMLKMFQLMLSLYCMLKISQDSSKNTFVCLFNCFRLNFKSAHFLLKLLA